MRAFLAALILCVCAVAPARTRDDGRYAQMDPKLRAWFDHLASGRGPCCSFADRISIQDVDRDTQKDDAGAVHYDVSRGATIPSVALADIACPDSGRCDGGYRRCGGSVKDARKRPSPLLAFILNEGR